MIDIDQLFEIWPQTLELDGYRPNWDYGALDPVAEAAQPVSPSAAPPSTA